MLNIKSPQEPFKVHMQNTNFTSCIISTNPKIITFLYIVQHIKSIPRAGIQSPASYLLFE